MIEKTSTDLKKDENLKIKGRKKSAVTRPGGASFTTAIENSLNFEFHGTIEELMNDLKDQEKRFLDEQSIYELARYKSIVQTILKQLLNDGLRTATLKRKRRNKADFVIVEEINSKLADISTAIIRNNTAFNLMKTIEEIRGLILDLRY